MTRLADVIMPDMQKPMSDLDYLRQLDPSRCVTYLKDGNYGGRYEREDEEIMKSGEQVWKKRANC